MRAWVPAGARAGSGESIGSPSRARTAATTTMLMTAASFPATAGGVVNPSDRNGGDSRAGRSGSRHAGAGAGAKAGGTRDHRGKGQTQTRAGRAAAKGRQDRVAERLANATAAAPDPAGFERSEFVCADGVTLVPYAVVGIGGLPVAAGVEPSGGSGGDGADERGRGGKDDASAAAAAATPASHVINFVAVHDFFDTLEKTFLLFKPLVLKHPGCQVLCFNSPGQAGTRLPREPEGLLTNVWVADRLHELMQVKNVNPFSPSKFVVGKTQSPETRGGLV